MKISLDWVNDFVDLDGLEAEALVDRLTMATAEVEGFEVLERSLGGMVVGEVVQVEPLPSGTGTGLSGSGFARLHLATVDCGTRRYVTVCGAPNVHPALKAVFAPAGAALAGGDIIEEAEVAGRRSEGVLCSAAEMGLSEFHDCLLEVPGAIQAGTPLTELIPTSDVILEIDNKSLTHRPDLWGHYGFARELSALLGRPLRPLPMADLKTYDSLRTYPVAIDDLQGCPCYTCLEMEAPGAMPAPLHLQARLHGLGQRSYSLLVDLTNYIMMELGQPTHAFDGDRLSAVRVAPMGREGTFVTLDGQQRIMLPDDLMIFNEREPVAIAGVMGGQNSEVGPRTTRLLLESASFRGSRVRRTSVRLGLRTEASQRFEKNQPPVNARTAVARFLQLMGEAGVKPSVTSRFSVQGDLGDRPRPLVLPAGFLQARAGQEIPRDRVLTILASLGFGARADEGGGLQVEIPPHRSAQDISIPEDILEEVLRIHGYDNVEPRLPAARVSPVRPNNELRTDHKLRRLLAVAHGFCEVHTYSWFDDTWIEALGFEPGHTLSLKNPTARHHRRLRTTLIPNLLALVRLNRVHGESFRVFELGRVFVPTGSGHREISRLAGVSFTQEKGRSTEEHYCDVKGALEDLAVVAGGAPLAFVPGASGLAPWQQAGAWVALRRGEQRIGALGVLSGEFLERVAGGKGQVVWFELELDPLRGPVYPELTYQAPSIYPGSWHDFSLLWEVGRGFAALSSELDGFSHPLVTRREFLYLYKGKGLPAGQASYTFRFWLGSCQRTLSGEEIEAFRASFIGFIERRGISLR